jgi:hypothetical protein
MPQSAAPPAAYYVETAPGRFTSTQHAQGAWDPAHQHMGPVAGLLAHVIEQCAPRADLQLARVGYDILGVLPVGEVTATARVSRPGRTVELVEAELVAGGRLAVRAHAWRLLRADTTALAGSATPSMAGREEAVPWDGTKTWPGGFIASLEVRVLPGWVPGRGQVWLRPRVGLVASTTSTGSSVDASVDASSMARLFSVIDTMNGVAVRHDPRTVAFPNTDLTVHLFRRPGGEWLGLDVEVTFGATAVGMTSAVLHD